MPVQENQPHQLTALSINIKAATYHTPNEVCNKNQNSLLGVCSRFAFSCFSFAKINGKGISLYTLTGKRECPAHSKRAQYSFNRGLAILCIIEKLKVWQVNCCSDLQLIPSS